MQTKVKINLISIAEELLNNYGYIVMDINENRGSVNSEGSTVVEDSVMVLESDDEQSVEEFIKEQLMESEELGPNQKFTDAVMNQIVQDVHVVALRGLQSRIHKILEKYEEEEKEQVNMMLDKEYFVEEEE